MAEAVNVEELLARLGIDAGAVFVKLAQPGRADEIERETIAGPAARAAGVRTPALIASGEGFSVWQRVEGELLDDVPDATVWRDVGRQLAKLHAIERCDDPRGVLRRDDKRDGRPHLHALSAERAARVARWLDRLERVPVASPRLLHYDVHERNVMPFSDKRCA